MASNSIDVDIIEKLYKEGRTYKEIGDFLGISRGAVAGRLKRHRAWLLCGRDGTFRNIPMPKTKLPKIGEGITIMELKNDTCRYMIGDGRYCGHTTQNRSYCDHHHSICYTGKGKRL